MNKLSIVKIQLNEETYQFSAAVDGVPLYKYFEKCIDDDISDSIALPFSDPHNLKEMAMTVAKHRAYIILEQHT